MHSQLYHLQININPEHLPFYKSFMTFMGWSVIFEMPNVCGFRSKTNGDLWFVKSQKDGPSDYDKFGVNHIALRVEKKSEIDDVALFLKEQGVACLFETPRHRPEFSESDKHTYYQVMFKTEDNILFEVVYIGAK